MTGPVPAHGTGTAPYGPPDDGPRWLPEAAPQSPAPAPAYRPVTADEYARVRETQTPGPLLRGPAAPLPEEEPPTEDPGQHYDDVRAEVATEREREDADDEAAGRDIPDGAIAVPLEGRRGRGVIHVLDPQDWPTAANGDLRVGDFESWASECLAPGDYEDVWQDVDPTLRHVDAMFREWRRLTGNDRGKSPRSMASYRRTRRR
ncbi:hypothetical protein AB0B88_16210 [Micromonospora haikouensis]|uniref:hypothetical protein n=1 Tax=Micromonospora haikouensis TaxID=686309 RepID=UPI003404E1D1